MKKLMTLMLGLTLAIGSVEESSLTVWRKQGIAEIPGTIWEHICNSFWARFRRT
jgi:hypothetical protein